MTDGDCNTILNRTIDARIREASLNDGLNRSVYNCCAVLVVGLTETRVLSDPRWLQPAVTLTEAEPATAGVYNEHNENNL